MTTKLTNLNIDTSTITSIGNLANLTVSNSIFLGNATFNESKIFPFNLVISPETLVLNVVATEAGDDVHWFWSWDQGALPFARTTITNSNQLSVPIYMQGTYQLNNFSGNANIGNATQHHEGYLKWVDGAGVDNLVSWAVEAGNVNFSNPNINGGTTTSVQRINITVPSSITIPTLNAPNVSYNVSHVNANTFTFSGMAEGENKALGPMYRGGTYTFNLDSSLSSYPFYLTTDNGTGFIANSYVGEFTNGVTGSRNNGTTGKTTLTFVVPSNAPDTLFYQSATNANMHGAITIKDLAVETNVNGNHVLYFQHMDEGHKTPIEIKPMPSMVNQMCVVYDATTGKFVPQDLATYVDNTPSFKNKIQEVAGTATLVAPSGVAVVPTVLIVEDVSYLPLVGNKDGDIAFDSYYSTLYVWGSNKWNNTKPTSVATVTTNAQPNITSVGTLANLTVSGNVTLGTIANVHVNGGSNGQYIKTDGNGNLSFTTVTVPDPLHPFLLGGM